jgi:hypothetical protein
VGRLDRPLRAVRHVAARTPRRSVLLGVALASLLVAAAPPQHAGCAHLKGATFWLTIKVDSSDAVSEW